MNRRRVAGALLIGLVVVLVALASIVAWIVLTPGGTRWVAGQAVARVAALELESIDGTVGRGLRLRGLRFLPEQGTGVEIADLRARLDARGLWRRTLVIEDLAVAGVRVRLGEAPEEPEPKEPFSLEPPLDLIVRRATVTDATVDSADARLATVQRADLEGRWTRRAGLEIEQLSVVAREGRIRFQGQFDGAPGRWQADADANVRWRIGERRFAGTARIATEDARLRLEARTSAPLALHLGGVFDQAAGEWQADLRVPAFDPRAELAPGAPVAVVAATLHGNGTDRSATFNGEVTLGDDLVRIDDLALALESDPEALRLERLVLRLNDDPGVLEANGLAQLEVDPVSAELQAQWRDLTLPEAWVGQQLATRGQLAARGSVENHAADGELSIGPPGRLADVRFSVRGTPQRLALEQFEVRQDAGRLDVTGTLDLAPQRGWTLEAGARDFDPGVLLADWPGRLQLDLRTQGVMAPEGPRGTLTLQSLRGRLRDRKIQGHGTLEFALPDSIAGDLVLESGKSRLRVDARPGDTLDARARIQVADAADFLPGSRGRIDGDLRMRGRWPEVRVGGQVDGRDLALAELRVQQVRIEADVRNPTDPSGEVTLVAREIVAGALEFSELRADADGNRASHRLELRATGEPLSVATRVSGSLQDSGGAWSGRVASLELGVRDDLRLDLQAPVAVSYSAGGLDVEQACLRTRGEASELCASFASKADGTLRADYRLSDVPLALANLAMPDTLPGQLEGTVAGQGQVRRGTDALWHGELSLASERARIVWADDGPGALGGETLLVYENLRLDGRLEGARASGRASAGLAGTGRLTAELTADGLDQAAARLAGRVQASLPTLEVVAPFVPQVAGLQGRVEVDARISGTTLEPQFGGFVRAADLAGELPLLGIELRDGNLRAQSRDDGRIALAGSMRSGRGELVLDGLATRTGQVEATVRGRNFVAADLEGVRVLAAPELQFERDEAGMALTGEVVIEEAKINLQRLPRAKPGARSVSPDVVIVNEPPPAAEEQVASALPLTATVTVRMGEDAVELTGFGLDATVDGQLTVREQPGRETTASGELEVAGTYKAYGQDLTIRQGQVLYAGTPVDNPRLRIEAVREVDEVTAGLRITGSAQDPQIDVFSDPTLGQTDALAYLVTGRPMSSIGTAGEGDSDLMQEASQSLGTAAGGLLAKRLGQRLGIDEFGIAKSEEIGGAALTIGQYLSPRLYVGFGVGLFDPGQVVTLRYEVSRSVSVEAVTSDVTTRAGVDYRVER